MANPSRYLNTLAPERAHAELFRCCGSERWVQGMLARRPFASDAELHELARDLWRELSEQDYLEAFAQHPEIGADLAKLREKFASSAQWSNAEQAGVNGASEQTLAALRDGNLAYKQRFGFLFIVCATGKSAPEMLALLRARLPHERGRELEVAAEEQAKITALRLEKLGP
ncbi:MAG: 2-oxo-4-hydroxy-4-carboxy-5-ureidoimidazoline decarboxylase [Myxococcales bacterium]